MTTEVQREPEPWELLEDETSTEESNLPAVPLSPKEQELLEVEESDKGPIKNLRDLDSKQVAHLAKMFSYPFKYNGVLRDMRQILAHRKKLGFLYALAATGRPLTAAKMVGYTNTVTLNAWRRSDPAFSEAWNLALLAAADVAEDVVVGDALEGVLEPIYFEGKIVGYVRKRSPKLQEIVLKRHKPEYREKVDIETTHILKNTGIALLPAVVFDERLWLEKAKQTHEKHKIIDVTPTEVIDSAPKIAHTPMKIERGR